MGLPGGSASLTGYQYGATGSNPTLSQPQQAGMQAVEGRNIIGRLHDWLFGSGEATKGMVDGPATADYQRDYLKNMLGLQLDTSQQQGARNQQNMLAGQLFQQAAGNTAGAGELAVNRQIGQAQAAQTANVATARGGNMALANREAARNMSSLGVNGAGQAAIAQMQDQAAARSQLAPLLGNMRAQDLGVVQANQNQDQLRINALAQLLGVDKAVLEQDLAKRTLAAQDKGAIGSLFQMGGQLGAAYLGRQKSGE